MSIFCLKRQTNLESNIKMNVEVIGSY